MHTTPAGTPARGVFNPCLDVLRFGLVEVFGGTASNPQFTLCPNNTGGYVPTGGVQLNGIVLPAALVSTLVFTPSSNGGTVAINPQMIINTISGIVLTGVQQTLTVVVQPDNGGTPIQIQQLTALTGSGSIGGFPIKGGLTSLALTLQRAPGGIEIYGTRFGLTLTLPSIFKTTNGTAAEGAVVVLAANANSDGTSNSAGLTFAGAMIEIGSTTSTTGGILLGPAQVTYLCLSYTGPGPGGAVPSCQSSGAGFVGMFTQSCLGLSPPTLTGDAWDGRIMIRVPPTPTGLLIDAAAGTKSGNFSYTAALVSALNVALYPSVTLNKIGFGICIIPTTTSGGGLLLSGQIGLKIASVINGDITLEYKTTKNAALSGKINNVVVPNAPFDSQPTKWYVDAKGTLSISGSSATIGSSEIYISPNAIGFTGQFGGSWTASGSVSFLSGSAAVSIGAAVSAQVSLTNNAFNIFTHIWGSASGTLTVNTTYAGFGVNLTASANASGNGTLAVSNFGFGACLNLGGSVSGNVAVTKWVGWPFNQNVTVASGSITKNFNFSLGVTKGFVTANPAPNPAPNTPAGYSQNFHAFWGACDITPYKNVGLVGIKYQVSPDTVAPPRAFLSRGSITGAARAIPLKIEEGQRGQLISVIGKNAPPQITITAPNGEKLSTPTEAEGRPAISPHMIVFVNTASKQTFIALGKPPAGTYMIALKAGSTPIIEVRRADVLPPPEVTARISAGSGQTRFLHYSIRPIPGQSVQFFEQGPLEQGMGGFAALGPLQGVTSRSGVIRFNSADGPRQLRTIIALVSQRGLPRTELQVATYSAPGPIIGKG